MSSASSTALAAALADVSDVIGDESKLFLLDRLSEVAEGPCTNPHEVFAGVTGAFLACTNRMVPEARQRAANELGRRGRAVITALVAEKDVRDQTIAIAQRFRVVTD